MDWKRAKAILIIMFLVVNTFLFYQLVSSGRNQYKYTSKQELESITQYLEGKNVKLETEIPDSVPVIPSLRVKYEAFEVEQIEKMFFQGKEYKLVELNDGFEMSSGDVSVQVKNGIYMIYKNAAIKIKQGEVSKEKCLSQTDRFIETLKLNTGNKYTKLYEIQNGYTRMILGQQYKDTPIENSEIEVIATEEGVAEAKVNWFQWIKPDRRYNITTPVIALLTVFENRKGETSPIVVKQIRQGYYFNVDLTKDNEQELSFEGTALPMWVITSDNSQIYINAYSEEFEKVQ